MSAEYMRVLVRRRVPTRRSLLLVMWPGRPAEAVPMLTAFLGAVARLAEIVSTIIAAGAVVV
jgi:hypothetical protein